MSSAESGRANYRRYVATGCLPSDFSVIESGGYDTLFKLSSDPKKSLLEAIRASYEDTSGDGIIKATKSSNAAKILTCIDLLAAEGKGWDSEKAEGDWCAIWSLNSKKSPTIQKAVGKTEKLGKAMSNFCTTSMTFDNLSYTKRGNGELKAVVSYNVSVVVIMIMITYDTTL